MGEALYFSYAIHSRGSLPSEAGSPQSSNILKHVDLNAYLLDIPLRGKKVLP
jgi:hypothetical protein